MYKEDQVQFWENIYLADDAGWDLGGATPVFKSIANELIPGKMCIVGCGSGHDAVMFAQKQFEVTGVDFAESAVKTLEAKAGSVIIFTEALAHGTAPWKSDNTRRSLLFKYTPSYMAFTRSYAPLPTDITLTKRQKDLYNLPSASGSFNRPTHFE